MNVKAKDTLERMKAAVMGTFDVVHYVFVFWVSFFLYHYNYQSFDKYHYYSPIQKTVITILPVFEKCHAIRLGRPWAQLQRMKHTATSVWTVLPSATSLSLLTDT
jgi:hypothetical protein